MQGVRRLGNIEPFDDLSSDWIFYGRGLTLFLSFNNVSEDNKAQAFLFDRAKKLHGLLKSLVVPICLSTRHSKSWGGYTWHPLGTQSIDNWWASHLLSMFQNLKLNPLPTSSQNCVGSCGRVTSKDFWKKLCKIGLFAEYKEWPYNECCLLKTRNLHSKSLSKKLSQRGP